MDRNIPWTGIFLQRSTDSHYSDYKLHLRCIEILSNISNKMSQTIRIRIIPSRLAAIRISPTGHHIIPSLKPGKTGKFISILWIVTRINSLDIREYPFYMIHHQTIEFTGLLSLVCFDFLNVFSTSLEIFQFIFIEYIRSCRRRAKISMNRFPSPRGFDNENRLFQCFLGIDAKSIFGPDFFSHLLRHPT